MTELDIALKWLACLSFVAVAADPTRLEMERALQLYAALERLGACSLAADTVCMRG